jgi:voltage-gated potassium channel
VGAAVADSRAERPIKVILVALVIGAAILDLRRRERHKRFAIVPIGGAVVLLSLVDLVWHERVPLLANALLVLFAGFVVWRAYTAVMRRECSAGDRIVGAICVYVLIGLAWAKTYETLDGVAPGSFRFPEDTAWATPSSVRYSYFSLVTLATLGYGDVAPVTALAGTLAWIEAITGQLYLAITVARLVALSITDPSA